MRREETSVTDKESEIQKTREERGEREGGKEGENIGKVIATDPASVYHPSLDIHVSSYQSNRSVGRYSCQ